jgi:Tol biopolymer transport system component
VTFKAGTEEYDVAVPTVVGQTNCNGGYCVTLNADGSLSFTTQAGAKDISHIQLWQGGGTDGVDGVDDVAVDDGTPADDGGTTDDTGADDGDDDGGNEKVTICHIPPGNPEAAHTITISVNALDAHLAHGDVEGGCTGEGDDGGDGGDDQGADDGGNEKVTICHVPPGNPENAHTITISVSALDAHLAHGDYEGACAGADDGGDGGDDDGGKKITICHIPPGNPENAQEITISENALPAHLAHGDVVGGCTGEEDGDGGDDGGNEKVTICHIPPGNPENAHEITISVNALPAHLAHGDYEGACVPTPDDGGDDGGDKKITICHIPPGNPENAHEITISESALPAHLAHGDYAGACVPGGDDGDGGDDGNEKITICHIPPGNPENAHEITISVNALPAHLAHGDYEGACVPVADDDGGTPDDVAADDDDGTPDDVAADDQGDGTDDVAADDDDGTPDDVAADDQGDGTDDVAADDGGDDEIAVRNICGAMTALPGGGNGPGFPQINLDPSACAGQEQPVEWQPIVVGAKTCEDWLVYHTNQTGDWEIFRLGLLPGNPAANPNLSQGVGEGVFDLAPARSPDNKYIAFSSNRDGNWEIYIAAADGTMQQRVTRNDISIDLDPVWSPAGDKIIYESTVDGNWELWMVDLATGAKTRLTDHPANDINAFFSPDGTKAVFQSDREGGLWQIYLIDLTTFDITKLSDGTGDDHDPEFSNDGTKIVFRSYRGDPSGLKGAIYVMNLDGSGVTLVSDPAGSATNHAWSPDDSLIAYQSDKNNGYNDIYVYELSSGKTRQLTDHQGLGYDNIQDVAPTWICESTTVVWTSDQEGDNNIYSHDALPIDSASIKTDVDAAQLTTELDNDRDPQNSPLEENASRGGSVPSKYNG